MILKLQSAADALASGEESDSEDLPKVTFKQDGETKISTESGDDYSYS